MWRFEHFLGQSATSKAIATPLVRVADPGLDIPKELYAQEKGWRGNCQSFASALVCHFCQLPATARGGMTLIRPTGLAHSSKYSRKGGSQAWRG